MADFDHRDRYGNKDPRANDPLDTLRDAWAKLPMPEPVRDLEDEDSVTQQAVKWMADGWKNIPIPATPPLQSARPVQKRRMRSWVIPSLSLAAAGLLLALATWRFMQPPTNTEPLTEKMVNAEGEGNVVGSDPGEADPDAVATTTQANQPSAKLVENNDEKVQILAGKVRLTMLRGTAASRAPQNDQTEF